MISNANNRSWMIYYNVAPPISRSVLTSKNNSQQRLTTTSSPTLVKKIVSMNDSGSCISSCSCSPMGCCIQHRGSVTSRSHISTLASPKCCRSGIGCNCHSTRHYDRPNNSSAPRYRVSSGEGVSAARARDSR